MVHQTRSQQMVHLDDLAQAFAGHFQYNLEIVPVCLTLLRTEKKPEERFCEFGSSGENRSQGPMREGEMVDYFLQTLDPTYFGYLVTTVGKYFNEVVKIGVMIEKGLRSDKILNYSALLATTQAIQSGTGGALGRKKKEEVATVEAASWSRSSKPYYNQPRLYHPNYPYSPYNPPQHYLPQEPHFSVHQAQTYNLRFAQWRAAAPQNAYAPP